MDTQLMDLQLINSELCESRMFNYTRRFATLTGREIADLLFLNTLMLYVYSIDDPEYAEQQAKKTIQYGMYRSFNTAATDLYLLAFAVTNPENRNVRYNKNFSSERFLKSLLFDSRRHYAFVRSIADNSISDGAAATYLMRLQNQLNIDSSEFRNLRRQILKWRSLSEESKTYILKRMQFRHKMLVPFGDNYNHTKQLVKTSGRDKMGAQDASSGDVLARTVGTMAGAAAGRYAGKKIAQATGFDPAKTKNIGTGLGAIAGYWASGRKSAP